MFQHTVTAFLASALSCTAAVLTQLPTPIEQGGMIHLNVSLNGTTLSAEAEAGTPTLQPLSLWKPGDSLSPTSPWYSTLDPDQLAGVFNSQFGLVLFESDPIPAGGKIMVSLISGTPGLDAYRWRNTAPQLFDPILGTNGSATRWDWGSVAHGMMHPVFVMPAGSSGTASVTLGFTLADSSGTALPGYSTAQATLNFNVVPEPATPLCAALASLLTLRRRRTRSTS